MDLFFNIDLNNFLDVSSPITIMLILGGSLSELPANELMGKSGYIHPKLKRKDTHTKQKQKKTQYTNMEGLPS